MYWPDGIKTRALSAENAEDAEYCWAGDSVYRDHFACTVMSSHQVELLFAKDAYWDLPQRAGTFCKRSLAADRCRKNHPQVGRKRPLTVKPASNEHFGVFGVFRVLCGKID